jgi:hypothetical protein
LGLEGGKDKLARLLRDCADLDDLASSLGFDNSEGLAAYSGLDDRRELASLLNSATDEGKSVANDGKLVADDGKLATDEGKLVTDNGGSAAKGAAGADEEAPSLTISNPLSPASSAASPPPTPPPPPPPPTTTPPPKASEPSPPAAEEPPSALDGFLSPPASEPSLG